MTGKQVKTVTLVNGQGVKVSVDESKVAGLKSSGFRRQGGRPPAAKRAESKPSDTSE